MIKEIQAGYLASPHFKDLYLYLAHNKLPSKRSVIHKVENLAERFILLDSTAFKISDYSRERYSCYWQYQKCCMTQAYLQDTKVL